MTSTPSVATGVRIGSDGVDGAVGGSTDTTSGADVSAKSGICAQSTSLSGATVPWPFDTGSVPSNPVASIGPYSVAGSTTSTSRPGADGTSRTCTPCLLASNETTDMPSVGSTDKPTIGGLTRRSLSSLEALGADSDTLVGDRDQIVLAGVSAGNRDTALGW